MHVRLLWPLLILLLLSACYSPLKPDLERLYATARTDIRQPPVIVVHGILGARLRTQSTEEEVWPGRLTQLLFSDYAQLAQDIDPITLTASPGDLETFGITDRAAGRDYYGALLRTLETAGGFAPAQAGQTATPGDRRYYVFTYDWRQDNVQSAAQLDQLIDQIRKDYDDPSLKVDLIAHSMGGLLVRYFLRYGGKDVLNGNQFPISMHGASRVRRVALLGTPNLGSVTSLHAFISGYPIGLNALPTEVLATMPSAYQLFPHPLNDWIMTTAGTPLNRDLFDVRIWRRFQWSVFDPEVAQRVIDGFEHSAEGRDYLHTLQAFFERQLERARRFVWSLTVEVEETPWRLVVFGGDCQMTPSRIVVEEVDGQSEIRLRPGDIRKAVAGVDYQHLMLEPGDGTVTKSSLLARHTLNPSVARHEYIFFPLDYPIFSCEEHDQLTGNINFQDNLLQYLLSQD